MNFRDDQALETGMLYMGSMLWRSLLRKDVLLGAIDKLDITIRRKTFMTPQKDPV